MRGGHWRGWGCSRARELLALRFGCWPHVSWSWGHGADPQRRVAHSRYLAIFISARRRPAMGPATQGSNPWHFMPPLSMHGVPTHLNASQMPCLGRGAGGGCARLRMGATSSVVAVQNLLGPRRTWYCGNKLLGQKTVLLEDASVGFFCCSSGLFFFYNFCLALLTGDTVLHSIAERPGVMVLSNSSWQ